MSTENAHTMDDLRIMQALPLSVKVAMTQTRIRAWVDQFGKDGVYVSFSGGKDSTVLLHLVRELYPEIPAVFVDTGLEYPEIRQFVKTFENVEILRPKMNFKQVIEKYGYPFISKEVSKDVENARRFYKNIDKYKDKKPLPIQNNGESYCPYAVMKLKGELNGGDSMFNQKQWEFLIDAPFEMSAKCCDIMKKAPFKKYEKINGKHPFTAQMATESRWRLKAWLQNGCNAFNSAHPISNPMSFWREQDVLRYIKENHIPIASVYGDIIPVSDSDFENQMDFADLGLCEDNRPLRTTGCERTGCMFCGFGCHLESNPNRFELMKKTHPKQYEWIMRDWDDGGLGYKKIIDWINENGDFDIKY